MGRADNKPRRPTWKRNPPLEIGFTQWCWTQGREDRTQDVHKTEWTEIVRFDVGKVGAEKFPTPALLSRWLETLPEMGSRVEIRVPE